MNDVTTTRVVTNQYGSHLVELKTEVRNCARCPGRFNVVSGPGRRRLLCDDCRRRNRRATETPCSVNGCHRPRRARGLCPMHYKRVTDLGWPNPGSAEPVPRSSRDGFCSVDGCAKAINAREFCIVHYTRWKKYGDPLKGGPRKKTGRVKNKAGYVLVWQPGGYIMEHRLAMQRMIGRELLPGENVHHVNGVKDDNRPENLELWSTSQPSGQRVDDKIAWAREFLETYGYVVSEPEQQRLFIAS